MEHCDKTAERLEMAALKEGNHTHVAVDIDWRVSWIGCHCQWYFGNHHPRILHYRHGAVASQIGHPLEPYSLSLVEIRSSTCSVNKDWGELLLMYDVM